MSLQLAVNNKKLSKTESVLINFKARLCAKILCLSNKVDEQKKRYCDEYVRALMADDTEKLTAINMILSGLIGKRRAYRKTIELIKEDI